MPPKTIKTEKSAAISLVESRTFNTRTKYLDIQFQLTEEIFKCGVVSVSYLTSELQTGIILTKPIKKKTLRNLLPSIINVFYHTQ